MKPGKDSIKEFSEKNNVSMILLFGSRATDRFREDSDTDLGILFKGDYVYEDVLTGLMDLYPMSKIDVVVLNRSDPLINFQILSKHEIIYCPDSEVYLRFFSDTVKKYNDMQKIYRLADKYLTYFTGGKHHGRIPLTSLAQYIKELEPLEKYTIEEYTDNYFIKRTGERLVQLIVENMVDINSMIIAEENQPPPKDYYVSFKIMSKLGYLPQQFAQDLAPCTGMRNRVVHEYDKIDDDIVFSNIPKLNKMATEYIKYVNNSL